MTSILFYRYTDECAEEIEEEAALTDEDRAADDYNKTKEFLKLQDCNWRLGNATYATDAFFTSLKLSKLAGDSGKKISFGSEVKLGYMLE